MPAHKRREHAEQGSQPGWNAAAGAETEQRLPARGPHICRHRAYMGHPANGRCYLDLKRTKTDAPGWRCAAVCCSVCCLPNCGGVGRNLIKKNGCTGLSTKSNGSRVECEITPIMLWMSSNKRYIWYFTLHYGNLPSKQCGVKSANFQSSKHFAVTEKKSVRATPIFGL